MFFPAERNLTGLVEWPDKQKAVEALILANHTTMENPSKYINHNAIWVSIKTTMPFDINLQWTRIGIFVGLTYLNAWLFSVWYIVYLLVYDEGLVYFIESIIWFCENCKIYSLLNLPLFPSILFFFYRRSLPIHIQAVFFQRSSCPVNNCHPCYLQQSHATTKYSGISLTQLMWATGWPWC